MERTPEENAKIRDQIREIKSKQSAIEDKSLVMVHTVKGKGKTSAALGVTLRMLAHGKKVAMVQFMKNPNDFRYAEQKLADVFPHFEIYTMGAGFTWNTEDRELDIRTTRETWEKAIELIQSGKFDLVVLDEINYVISYGLLEESLVLGMLKNKPAHLHLILTGRDASQALIEAADMVTEMTDVKHHYAGRGISAQKGIEW